MSSMKLYENAYRPIQQESSPAQKTSQKYAYASAVFSIIAGCVAWGMAISLIGQAAYHETIHVSTTGWVFVGIGSAALLTTIGLVAARHFHRKQHGLQDDLRGQMKWSALQMVGGPIAMAIFLAGAFCCSKN